MAGGRKQKSGQGPVFALLIFPNQTLPTAVTPLEHGQRERDREGG